MSADMKPLSWEAVRATAALAEQARAENATRGTFACNRCADTKIVPAPEPYGSWGCTWPCQECAADVIAAHLSETAARLREIAVGNAILEAEHREKDTEH